MKKVLKIVGIGLTTLVIALIALVLVAASRAGAKLTFTGEPPPVPAIVASTDPAVIARGRYLVYGPAHCSQCHGDYTRERPEDNREGVPLSGGFEFAMGPIGTTWAANLTPAGIGKMSDAEVARAIATGVQHDGMLSVLMRYSAANLSAEDLAAVISFLRSVPPVAKDVKRGELTIVGKAAASFFGFTPDRKPLPTHVAESTEPSLERGGYLAESVCLCVGCHTTYDPSTFEPNGPKAAGGSVEPSHGSDKNKEFAPPNLTASPQGMTGKLDEDAFVARLRAGRAIASSVMPWENFGRMSDADLRSVYRYLRSLPPVANDPGPSYRDVGWKPK